jgi:hypothetical protein
MSLTKKQRAYAHRLGRDLARYQQDTAVAVGHIIPGDGDLYLAVMHTPLTEGTVLGGALEDVAALRTEWAGGYREQVELFESCHHHFTAGRALSPTENARCTKCHVSIMSGYLLPLEGES